MLTQKHHKQKINELIYNKISNPEIMRFISTAQNWLFLIIKKNVNQEKSQLTKRIHL